MADNTPNDVNRVTPQHVEPDRQNTGGGQTGETDSKDKTSGRLRRSDTTVEATGGDQAGVAGGAIDSKVSGRGGDLP